MSEISWPEDGIIKRLKEMIQNMGGQKEIEKHIVESTESYLKYLKYKNKILDLGHDEDITLYCRMHSNAESVRSDGWRKYYKLSPQDQKAFTARVKEKLQKAEFYAIKSSIWNKADKSLQKFGRLMYGQLSPEEQKTLKAEMKAEEVAHKHKKNK